MAFVNVPGRTYTDPIVWHEDPVHRVHGSTATANSFNHTIDIDGTGGPVAFESSSSAHGLFTQGPGGPYPGSAATDCAWGKVSKGRNLDTTIWDGSCPVGDDGPANTGSNRGSTFTTSTDPDTLLIDSSDADAMVSGWLIRPWLFPTHDNPWMDDAALEAEYLAAEAAATAALPGDGWFIEWEYFYPIFQGYELAPDETITGVPGARTEPIVWLHSPEPGAWMLQGLEPDFTSDWSTGNSPAGEELATYPGGLADWVPAPESWLQPEQDLSAVVFGGQFVVPEDEAAASIPLTAVCETVLTGTYPGDTASGGRQNQTLLVRAIWQTPRFRFYREGTPATRQWSRSPDSLGLSAGTRLWPAPKSARIVGGEQ